MRMLIRLLLIGAGVISITTMQIVHSTIFEHPVSLINIAFLAMLIGMFVFETRIIVSFSLLIFFIIDLYSDLTPFGIVLTAGTISMLAAYWLHRDIFTNRSWLAATGISFLSLISYRAIYTVLLLFVQLVQGEITIVWGRLLQVFLWEVILTSIGVGLVILILSFFITSLRLNAIEQKMFWLK